MIIHWQLFAVLSVLAAVIHCKKETLIKSNSKCPEITECPFRSQPCADDDECSPDSICCTSPCGQVCTKQLYTGCETLKRAASRRAKALGDNKRSVRIPRCTKTGSFEPVQCDNEIVSSCWCADETGFEIPGTRAPAAALVNCSSPKPCAAHTCRMFCPIGFALAPDGCPLCRCHDPCDDIRCPNALTCHLEEFACSDPPCPPVPTCKRGRSLANICPVGDPLRISDTVRPFLCGNDPGKPNCPPMYQCFVEKGNDYGVCCPASLQIKKTGTCPERKDKVFECGSMCTHDLECPSVQKCCSTEQCGSSCVHPKNVTECYHQRALSDLLSVSERIGRGYTPQCSEDGQFEPRQCSRNGLVCWCVDRMGHKIKGTMGAAANVSCSLTDARSQSVGRSIDKTCEQLECAAVCEYGFQMDDNGCPTCNCDVPCEGYTCPEDEECVAVKESTCTDFLCPTLPVCRPKMAYVNPCSQGTPQTDDLSGAPLTCDQNSMCPESHECIPVTGSSQAVCCPIPEPEQRPSDLDKSQSMCKYLHDFSESMEGTRDGMTLALSQPSCDSEGNFVATQCDKSDCWCVDHFGTEIPKTRGTVNATEDCDNLRETSECLDLTCRMGCDYGFILSEDTGCPTCQCRDPCSSVACKKEEQCQLVEVSCKDHYCPPVPACLPRKIGQCPYLVPTATISCDFECNSDLVCNGTARCCSNGCGTQCVEPLLLTACQHQQAVAQHQAHESGTPAGHVYIPKCKTDGSYEPLQCNPRAQECWCVDYRGFEISQTKTLSDKPLNCNNPPKSTECPMKKCRGGCDYGYVMDDKGCRTCQCVEPCSEINCRGDGEDCRLVNVECMDWPCPAVPMCLPKKENPCQSGEPLKLGNGVESMTCGPEYETCPSSHKCQLSPIGEYAVCCPKPRDVCFESLDIGLCSDGEIRNLTRYHFNSSTNRCESFTYSGCHGNHNNFHTEEMCRRVCPVLSQCERLREKNQRQAERYKKPTFMPRCELNTGNWEAVQCLEHVGVCWCVSPQGEPLKGTLTRGAEPKCNFRQARGRAKNLSDIGDADLALEKLIMQISSFEYNEPSQMEVEESGFISWEMPLQTRCESMGAQCDSHGKFLSAQCEQDICWCVDEAGNQLPHTNSFKKGEHLCIPTPVENIEVTLGFRGEYDDVSSLPIANQIRRLVQNLQGDIKNDIISEITNDVLYLKFSLIGSKKVDVAYRLEQMVKQQRLAGLTADITRSRFIHKLGSTEPLIAERVVALEHREIVSQSPVSMVAPYHTALIVIAAASAFVISVLTLLVILYRRKVTSLHAASNKIADGNQRFLPYNRPIYIELPNENVVPPESLPNLKLPTKP